MCGLLFWGWNKTNASDGAVTELQFQSSEFKDKAQTAIFKYPVRTAL
jgi:hypothetical protein